MISSITASLPVVGKGVSAIEYILLFVLFVYTVGAIIKSVRPSWTYDKIGYLARFIPQYNFFAPDPKVGHYEFTYRNRLVNGTWTDWKSVDKASFELRPRSAIWNPEAMRQKALNVLVLSLVYNLTGGYQIEDGPIRIEFIDDKVSDQSYSMLAEYAAEQLHHENAEFVQFRVIRYKRSNASTEEIVLSAIHGIQGNDE